MRSKALWLSLLLALVSLPVQAEEACEKLVATGNPEYPPYLWRDPANPGQLIGANAELLQHIGKELGLKVEVIHTGTWAQAQEEASSGRVDLLAGAFLTVPRLGVMDYIHPAFYQTPSVVWTQRGKSFPYSGWADLVGKQGATLVNNSFGQGFDQFAAQSLQVQQLPNLTQALQMLLLGRVDYVLYERYPSVALARQLGMQEQLESLEPPISSEGLYLTLSHNSACNDARLRGQLAQKMTELLNTDLPEIILQRNIERWQGQQVAPVEPPAAEENPL